MSTWVHPGCFGEVHVAYWFFFLLCAFWVPCCNVRYDIHIKRPMIGSSLPPVVCWRIHVLFTLFEYSGVRHTLCCVCALFFFVVCKLYCQFLWIVHIWLSCWCSLAFNYLQNTTQKTKDRATPITLKLGGNSRVLNSSCVTCGTRRVAIATITVIIHEWGNNQIVITPNGTYPLSFVTHIHFMYAVTVNQVMVVIVKLWKWWLQLNHY